MQLVGYYIARNKKLILRRFDNCTASLEKLSKEIGRSTAEYKVINEPGVIKNSNRGRFRIDVRSLIHTIINKEFLGLAAGVSLTLRCTNRSQGPVVRLGNVLCVESPPLKFISERSALNSELRKVLLNGIPSSVVIPVLTSSDFASFYQQMRRLEVKAPEIEITCEVMESFALAVMSTSSLFAIKILSANSPD